MFRLRTSPTSLKSRSTYYVPKQNSKNTTRLLNSIFQKRGSESFVVVGPKKNVARAKFVRGNFYGF